MSRTRLPSTSPTRTLPAASNVASLNGVSGLVEITGRCARTGVTDAEDDHENSQTSHTASRTHEPNRPNVDGVIDSPAIAAHLGDSRRRGSATIGA